MHPLGLSPLLNGREPETVLSTPPWWSTLLFNLVSSSVLYYCK